MKFSKTEADSAKKTAEVLLKGGVCILPTDTVYGFSAIVEPSDNNQYDTDGKIRRIKGRSETKPFIYLIANPSDIQKYTDIKLPEKLSSFWPGPLTVIVPNKKNFPLVSVSSTTAFRCPGDPWLREVISLCKAPLYSTSVNRSGNPVLDSENDIENEFGKEVELFVADGDKKNARPSTIVMLEEDGSYKVLRQGDIVL